ncbi:RRM domain containing [Cryptosporidium bovis]|uniref:RRM domain containing n=1 Tax=Cryptosporidium bovis TaxID=310047 RepID=UPI00351A2569|nr:RRM domain containing [Cryptosporidium bovis]
MSHLFHSIGPEYSYFDKKNYSKDEWFEKISNSTTVYVGNLSFFTTEEIIYDIFNQCGQISEIYMGLNSNTMQPCGFCFVKYLRHCDALAAVTFLNRTSCDGREIRVDWDSGDDISGSRRYGRGVTGFQWRDEMKKVADPDRYFEEKRVMKDGRFLIENNGGYTRSRGIRGRNHRFVNKNHGLQNRFKHQVTQNLEIRNSHQNKDLPDY